jgi:hypothetical protein
MKRKKLKENDSNVLLLISLLRICLFKKNHGIHYKKIYTYR